MEEIEVLVDQEIQRNNPSPEEMRKAHFTDGKGGCAPICSQIGKCSVLTQETSIPVTMVEKVTDLNLHWSHDTSFTTVEINAQLDDQSPCGAVVVHIDPIDLYDEKDVSVILMEVAQALLGASVAWSRR